MSETTQSALREEGLVAPPDDAAECARLRGIAASLRADNALLRGIVAKARTVLSKGNGGCVAATLRVLEGAPLR